MRYLITTKDRRLMLANDKEQLADLYKAFYDQIKSVEYRQGNTKQTVKHNRLYVHLTKVMLNRVTKRAKEIGARSAYEYLRLLINYELTHKVFFKNPYAINNTTD